MSFYRETYAIWPGEPVTEIHYDHTCLCCFSVLLSCTLCTIELFDWDMGTHAYSSKALKDNGKLFHCFGINQENAIIPPVTFMNKHTSNTRVYLHQARWSTQGSASCGLQSTGPEEAFPPAQLWSEVSSTESTQIVCSEAIRCKNKI